MSELKSTGAVIRAIAHHLPARVVTNQDIIDAESLRLKDAWVRENVGITERRFVAPGETAATMAADVARTLLERAGVDPSAVSRLVVATVSPDVPTPSTACIAQSLFAPGATFPCVDMVAACGGFAYALDYARRCVATGDEHVLCIASEVRSAFLDPRDRRTVMLFGDAAAGVLVSRPMPGEIGIVDTRLFADGRFWEAVSVPAGGVRRPASQATIDERAHFIAMKDGAAIFERAVTEMADLARAVANDHGLSVDEVEFFVFHQASARIVDRVAEVLGVSPERTHRNFAERGNVTAASVPLALSEASEAGKLKRGDRVVLVATGGGFTAGAALLRWELDR
jgi:3-oxoacyl-[acyl-carrier-protein] synthase-3